MSTIRLVRPGIFPITLDKDGNELKELVDTKLGIPGTLQGEGKTSGIPSIFIRTSGCNLRCAWLMEDNSVSICDTPYSSHNAVEYDDWDIDEVIRTVEMNLGDINHVVVTGGEPTKQSDALLELCKKLKEKLDVYVTIETNGTIFDEFANYVDLFSISPKLADSVPTLEKMKKVGMSIEPDREIKQRMLRRNIKVLQNFIDKCPDENKRYPDFQLKFVVTRPENVKEIKEDFLSNLTGWSNDDIILMPVGANLQELEKSMKMTAKIAIENGWRYTPRLQVDLFGNLPGV